MVPKKKEMLWVDRQVGDMKIKRQFGQSLPITTFTIRNKKRNT